MSDLKNIVPMKKKYTKPTIQSMEMDTDAALLQASQVNLPGDSTPTEIEETDGGSDWAE